MNWRLDHTAGDLFRLVNRTGEDAVHLQVSPVGPVVGSGGLRDWMRSFERVRGGANVEVKARAGWRGERPGLRLTWHTDADPDRVQTETVWLP